MVGSHVGGEEHVESGERRDSFLEETGSGGQESGVVVVLEESSGAEEEEAMGAYLVIASRDTS